MDLASDILPRECTPAEIKSSVAEAGKVLVNHVTVEQEAYSFSKGGSQNMCAEPILRTSIEEVSKNQMT
jgi:hypothetical protein